MGLNKGLLLMLIVGLMLFSFGCTEEKTTNEDVEGIKINRSLGDPNAPVVMIEYSDFQCPYCGRFHTETFPKIKENYVDTGKVRVIFKHYPLPFHGYAEGAALAAECAGEQGKFWEMVDKLFENQYALTKESLKRYASQIGLNMEEFNQCLDNKEYLGKVVADKKEGESLGVTGTPTFFINGEKVVGALPYEEFEKVIERKLNEIENKTN